MATEEERMQKKVKQGKNTDAFRKFNSVSPKPVRLEQEELIQTITLSAQEPQREEE